MVRPIGDRRIRFQSQDGEGFAQPAELDPVTLNGRFVWRGGHSVKLNAREAELRSGTDDACIPTRTYPSMAFRTAARASNRVESSVGIGDDSGVTSRGISVQPSTTASQPSSLSERITST